MDVEVGYESTKLKFYTGSVKPNWQVRGADDMTSEICTEGSEVNHASLSATLQTHCQDVVVFEVTA